ncbi:hypothetical protein V8F33_013528 [Rhypophila sp. PSN 637]
MGIVHRTWFHFDSIWSLHPLHTDKWAAAIVPPVPSWLKFKKKKKAIDDEAGGPPKVSEDGSSSDDDSIAPPLRSWTSLRGERARHHIHRGFEEYMHDQKVKAKTKALVVTGSKTHLPPKTHLVRIVRHRIKGVVGKCGVRTLF